MANGLDFKPKHHQKRRLILIKIEPKIMGIYDFLAWRLF
jgi:hypothetical protein